MAEPLPTTFESRGVLVGFHHRLLSNVRLRVPDQPGFKLRDVEAVIQNYTGTSNKHLLILPWLHVPNLAQPGKRDQRLYDAISQFERLETMDPLMMRALGNEIDRDDSDNEKNQERAKAETELAKVDRFRTYLAFLVQIARECGTAENDPALQLIDNQGVMSILENDGQRPGIARGEVFTARLFSYLAGRTSADLGELSRRIEQLTDLIAPFGAGWIDPKSGVDGYLARCVKRLRTFRTQMTGHEKTSTEEIANNCLLIIFAVKQYIDYIEQRRQDLLDKFPTFSTMIGHFDESVALIRRFRRAAAFAVDGWGPLVDIWDKAWQIKEEETRRVELDRAIFHILQLLPLMPSAELLGGDQTKRIWARYQFVRAKPIPQMYSWFDEKPDTELMERVEQAKVKAAEAGRRFGNDRPVLKGGRR